MKNFLKKVRKRLLSWWKLFRIKSDTIVLFGAPEHGNLGDHAISVAEVEFLKMNFSENVVEFSRREFYKLKSLLLKKIKSTNKLFITGGGFLGDLWPEEEKFVEDVIMTFPNVSICIFPQTIYFKEKKNVKNVLKIFNSHDNLLICAREKASFEFLKNEMKLKNVCLCPDIVLGYKPNIKKETNNKVVFCLRKDKEQNISKELVNHIEKTFEGQEIKQVSTVVDHNVFMFDRNKELKKLFETFAGAKLVVTDRLHAMIFSSILKVPCLAYNNVSGKVFGVYDLWLKKCDYVKTFADKDSFDKNFKKVSNASIKSDSMESLTNNFNDLAGKIKEFFK